MTIQNSKLSETYFLSLFIFIGILAFCYFVLANSKEDIVFPVKELGNCKNETECRAFCDKSENIEPCIAFAKKHNLLSKEELEKAEAFLKMGAGPGGCKNKDECEAFCENPANMDSCLDFAEKSNLMPTDELKEARQVAKALREGASLPGGCRNKNECERYCDETSHMNECLDFAEKAGFIPPDELQEARKAAKAFSAGLKPPGNCRGKKQCEQYCSEPSHMEECLTFAEAAGFISPEEVANARKIMPLMLAGEMPGGCKNREECEKYCENESNIEECANFALKAGFMSQEDYEMFKKTGGKGPGGCKGKEECENFCNNPENQETCFNFAKEHGLIPEEDIERMKEGLKMMREGMENAPPEIQDCLKTTIGEEVLNKIQTGEFMPSPEIGDKMRKCFESFRPQEMRQPEGREMPPIGFQGPGGCASPEECVAYCQDPTHLEECKNFLQRPLPRAIEERFSPSGQGPQMLPEGVRPPEGFNVPPEGSTTPPIGTMSPPPPPETQVLPFILNALRGVLEK